MWRLPVLLVSMAAICPSSAFAQEAGAQKAPTPTEEPAPPGKAGHDTHQVNLGDDTEPAAADDGAAVPTAGDVADPVAPQTSAVPRADAARPSNAASVDREQLDDAPEAEEDAGAGAEKAGKEPGKEEQERFRIALMDLEVGPGVDAALAKAMAQAMTRELEATGVFEAVSTEEIRQMLALEQTKAVVGCDTTSCLAEIASALGAEFTVFGSLVLLEGTYLLQLQLVNAEQARTLARSQRTYDGPPAGLIETAQGLLKVLVRDLLDQRSGTLDVRVSETDATVRIDGVIVGVTPLPPLQAAGGFHTVTVEKEGFVRFSKDVEVKQDKVSPVDIRLRPSAEYKAAYLKRAWTWRIAAWSSWGAAGLSGLLFAGIIAGAAAWTVALNGQIATYTSSVTNQTQANFDNLTLQANALFGLEIGAVGLALVSGGLIAAGTVAYLLGDDPWHFSDDAPTPPDTAAEGGAE